MNGELSLRTRELPPFAFKKTKFRIIAKYKYQKINNTKEYVKSETCDYLFYLTVIYHHNDDKQHDANKLASDVDDKFADTFLSNKLSRRKRETIVRPDFTMTINETHIGPIAKIQPFLEGERYEISEMTPPSGDFSIDLDPSNGIFSISEPGKLDYETAQTLELFITIYTLDGGRDTQRVIAKIRDVNDEKPRFVNSPQPLQAVVPIKALPGTLVYKLVARDSDAGAYLRYSLDLDNSKRFKVDPITGSVEVKPTQSPLLNGAPSDPGGLVHFGPTGMEYSLRVSVRDIAGSRDQIATQTLSIIAGTRPPQFYFPSALSDGDKETRNQNNNHHFFSMEVREDSDPDAILGHVKAKSFSNKALIYEITAQQRQNKENGDDDHASDKRGGTAAAFAIKNTPLGAQIRLIKKLDYEDFGQPKRFALRIEAKEIDDDGNHGLANSADLFIDVIDVNDNDPIFSQPEYVKQKVAEDIPIGTDILKISATDIDSGANGQIRYTLSDTDNFTVTETGIIRNRVRLDYEIRKHSYEFTAYATDMGVPKARTASALVKILVSNVNDESPAFSRSVYVPEIAEDAKPGALVTTVNAVDPDGDGVVYSFKGGAEYSDDFRINRDGVITINSDPGTTLRKEFYTLNVTATDDGSCCPNGATGGPRHVTEALVVVRVLDINNNKPEFPDCANYLPTVMENSPPGTPVITVKATDNDSGDNGRVRYKIEPGRFREPVFSVEPVTGMVRTALILDREKPGGLRRSLTVIATDLAPRPLIGVCTFSVIVGDTNDNEPSFSQSQYDKSIEANTPINTTFLRVAAQDPDEGPNADLHYGFEWDSPYFGIDPETGWISVKSSLLGETGEFNLTAFAADRGQPPLSSTVTVRIVITGENRYPPDWIDGPYRHTLSEMSPRGSQVATVFAISNHPDHRVQYSILPGNNPEQNSERNFELVTDPSNSSAALLRLYAALDYERVRKFNLTLRAKNNAPIPLVTDTYIEIAVLDANDNAPIFALDSYPASVAEDSPPGTRVVKVTAEDADSTFPNNRVSYSLVSDKDPYNDEGDQDWRSFEIDRDTGQLVTALPLDRETKSYYLLKVMAQDGSDSAINPGYPNSGYAYVRVNVEDVNDNVPYFLESLYVAEVNEDAAEGTVVIEVSAKDADEDFQRRYQLTTGNVGGVFDVKPQTGEIYVRGKLDYELGPREYILKVVVSDGLNENSASVRVHVKDVNDNAPEFERTLYEVRMLEETDTFTSQDGFITGLPHTILTIRATDRDTALPADIRYSLQGQGVEDGTFVVDPLSGSVNVTRKLDRDPPTGQPVWSLLALATDDGGAGNYGYADIRVTLEDLNDNAPRFRSSFEGTVPENAEAGRPVLTVTAVDSDDGANAVLVYGIKTNVLDSDKNPIFVIEPLNGLIRTQVANLDRELVDKYTIEVEAKDKDGLSGTGLVVIHVEDRNDQPPIFSQKIYRVTVSESVPPVSVSVLTLIARDADVGDNAKLTYSLKKEKGYKSSSEAPQVPENVDTFDDNDFDMKLENNFVPSGFYFSVITDEASNTGSLRVARPLDYDYNPDDIENAENYNNRDIGQPFKENARHRKKRATSAPYPLRFFVLQVAVSDGRFEDKAFVLVTLVDANDNPPRFIPSDFKRISVREDTPGGTLLAKFRAIDIDEGFNRKFDYFITDPANSVIDPALTSNDVVIDNILFSINSSGHVMLEDGGPSFFLLDSERARHHTLAILAVDRGIPPLIGRATLRIDVIDVNDNHPLLMLNKGFFYPDGASSSDRFPALPQFTETNMADPGATSWRPTVLGLFTAYDLDTLPGYGPPFKFYPLPCDVNPLCTAFNLSHVQDDGPNKDGAALVTCIKPFDRELSADQPHPRAFLDYPIKICDAGIPPLCGVDFLRVIISDINDNPIAVLDDKIAAPVMTYNKMEAIPNSIDDYYKATEKEKQVNDGMGGKKLANFKTITIYNYKDLLPDVLVGTVYASDPDDWLKPGDKNFTFVMSKTTHDYDFVRRHFWCDSDYGTVYMVKGTPEGSYTLEFVINDLKYNLRTSAAIKIMVVRIDEDAIANSGSLTLTGLAPEQFLGEAPTYFTTPLTPTYRLEGSGYDQYKKRRRNKRSKEDSTRFNGNENSLDFGQPSDTTITNNKERFRTKNAENVGPKNLGEYRIPTFNRLIIFKRLLLSALARKNGEISGEANIETANMVDEYRIEILSLVDSSLPRSGKNFPKMTDLRFAIKNIRDSSYVPPIKLNAILWVNREKFNKVLGSTITAIDLPLSCFEPNDDVHSARVKSASLINTNRTSILSYDFSLPSGHLSESYTSHPPFKNGISLMHRFAITPPILKQSCLSLGGNLGWCYNGGTCLDEDINGPIRCLCSAPHFRGPRCQLTSITLTHPSESWILLPSPLPIKRTNRVAYSLTNQGRVAQNNVCDDALPASATHPLISGSFQFRFEPDSENFKSGAAHHVTSLLYLGSPLGDYHALITLQDSVESVGGQGYLALTLASGPKNGENRGTREKRYESRVSRVPYSLTDGRWHEIDFGIGNHYVRLGLDSDCTFNRYAPIGGGVNPDNECENITFFDNDILANRQASSNPPVIVLGGGGKLGESSSGVKEKMISIGWNRDGQPEIVGLVGCYKELTINNMLYDFAIDTISSRVSKGCHSPQCDNFKGCSPNGECIAKAVGKFECLCYEGWYGVNCDKETQPVQLGKEPGLSSYLRLFIPPPSPHTFNQLHSIKTDQSEYVIPRVYDSRASTIEISFRTLSPFLPLAQNNGGRMKELDQNEDIVYRLFQAGSLDGAQYMHLDLVFPHPDTKTVGDQHFLPFESPRNTSSSSSSSILFGERETYRKEAASKYGYLRFRYDSGQIIEASKSASIISGAPSLTSSVFEVSSELCPLGDGHWKRVIVDRSDQLVSIVATCDRESTRAEKLQSRQSSYHADQQFNHMELDSSGFYLGARVREVGERKSEVVMQLKGCLKDFRFDGTSIQLTSERTGITDESHVTAAILESVNVVAGCFPENDGHSLCATDTCPNGQVCSQRWNHFVCECPPYFTPSLLASPALCLPLTCASFPYNPCMNGGICVPTSDWSIANGTDWSIKSDNLDTSYQRSFGGFRCECQSSWSCQLCDCPSSTSIIGKRSNFSENLGLTGAALTVISLALAFVIVLSSLIICYTRCSSRRSAKKDGSPHVYTDKTGSGGHLIRHFGLLSQAADEFETETEMEPDTEYDRQNKDGGAPGDDYENLGNFGGNDFQNGEEFDAAPSAYDLARLRKPLVNGKDTKAPLPKLSDLLKDRLPKADKDSEYPTYTPFHFSYEDDDGVGFPSKNGNLYGSLSSLGSGSGDEEDINFDCLNDWGPKFQKIADMCQSRDD